MTSLIGVVEMLISEIKENVGYGEAMMGVVVTEMNKLKERIGEYNDRKVV